MDRAHVGALPHAVWRRPSHNTDSTIMLSPVALFGIAAMSCVMSVAVLGSLLRVGVPGLPRWFAAYAALTAAFSMLLWQLEAVSPARVAMVNALLVAGAFLGLQGVRQFFGRPATSVLESTAFAGLVAILCYTTLVAPNVGARITLTSLFFIYVRLVIGWMAIRLRPPHRPFYCYLLVGVASLLGVAAHLARVVTYGFGLQTQVTTFDPSALNVTMLGLGIVSLPFLSISMVMLAHDRLVERMHRLATIDELTGALVRRAFMETASARTAQMQAIGRPLSIAILDLDNFKAVNDRHGHAAGDRALICFAAVVAAAIGPEDVFGRLGGEEFAVLFASKDKHEARRLANGLRMALAQASGNDTACTFSAGIEQFAPGDTMASVMLRADAALYAAKAMGRNCVATAREMDKDDGEWIGALD